MNLQILLAATCLLATTVVSCKKNDDSKNIAPQNVEACGVRDPVENLPWLKKILDERKAKGQDEMLNITMFRTGDKTVFNVQMIHMSCVGCLSYYCDGSQVEFGEFSEEEREVYFSSLNGEDKVILWPRK